MPAGIQGIVFSLSNLLVQNAINSLGPEAMAASAAAFIIELNLYCLIQGLGQTTTTFVGQNYGAKIFPAALTSRGRRSPFYVQKVQKQKSPRNANAANVSKFQELQGHRRAIALLLTIIISKNMEAVEMKRWIKVAFIVFCCIGMALNIEWGKETVKALITGGVTGCMITMLFRRS